MISDLVGGLGDLGEHMAGDEHRPAFGGEAAEKVAQPADAFGIEAVGRLVEDQQLGLAEQGGREAEPLPHSQGVALHSPLRRLLELDAAQRLVGVQVAQADRPAQRA